MSIQFGKKMVIYMAAAMISSQVFASTYSLPSANEDLIGQMQYISAGSDDTVVTIAERYDLGFNALKNANPHLSMKRQFPRGAAIQIPTQHLLPNYTRKGIVVNLPEMRMYYFPSDTDEVYTYPIGIGKVGKTIPIRKTVVTRKKQNPYWIPPKDIREFNLEQGIVLPKVMPPGPDNPLGTHAIYMSIPTYLFHSTIFPGSVGTRASFGCIRMYESDIEDFYPLVKPGIPIAIINTPFKAGWEDTNFYVEAHTPLNEHKTEFDSSLAGLIHIIANKTNQDTLIDWQLVSYLVDEEDGIPHQVGIKLQ